MSVEYDKNQDAARRVFSLSVTAANGHMDSHVIYPEDIIRTLMAGGADQTTVENINSTEQWLAACEEGTVECKCTVCDKQRAEPAELGCFVVLRPTGSADMLVAPVCEDCTPHLPNQEANTELSVKIARKLFGGAVETNLPQEDVPEGERKIAV